MIGPHKRCAEDRFVIIGALIDALRRQERGKIARHACGVTRNRLSLKDLEESIEERRVRRACAKIEHKPLQSVGEEADTGNRPGQFLDAKMFKRIRIGQERCRVDVLTMVRPQHRPPGMIRSIGGDNGAIPDLSDGTAAGVQDRHQKRAGEVMDLAVLMVG